MQSELFSSDKYKTRNMYQVLIHARLSALDSTVSYLIPNNFMKLVVLLLYPHYR